MPTSVSILPRALGATSLVALSVSQAIAQTADAGKDALAEVVVTAQFRQQNLQQTPIAITAVNAAMLEQRNQTDVSQIAAQAPNVTLQANGAAFGSSMVAFIRGVGQTDFNLALEPGVGIYVDDVYYATLTGSLLDLLDLDRVEPQAPEHLLHLRALLRGGGGEPRAHAAVGAVDQEGLARLRVLEFQQPDGGQRGLGAVAHHHGGAGRSEQAGDRPADASPRAGDDGDVPVEPEFRRIEHVAFLCSPPRHPRKGRRSTA